VCHLYLQRQPVLPRTQREPVALFAFGELGDPQLVFVDLLDQGRALQRQQLGRF